MNTPDYFASSQISTFIERIKFDQNVGNNGSDILMPVNNFHCFETEQFGSHSLASEYSKTSKVLFFYNLNDKFFTEINFLGLEFDFLIVWVVLVNFI